MAFMGRGDAPSIGHNDLGDIDSNFNDTERNCFYRGYWLGRRYYYYIPLDNTYVIMQIIIAMIFLIIGGIAYLATYKSTIVDPIENTKNLYMNTYSIINIILLAVTLITNFFSKNKIQLLNRLTGILIISILVMLVFFGIKLNMDMTYDEIRFKQFYTEQNIENKDNDKTKIDVGLTGVSVKTNEEYYIDECIKLYNIFKIKSYSIIGLNVLIIILLIYQISRISKIQDKKERLSKDDLILFDEEENVKF